MSPEDIKQLRQELRCSVRELAAALKLDSKEIVAWEAGQRFPTKRYVVQMAALRDKGPDAIPRLSKVAGLKRLEDPKLWRLVRKLIEHPAFFDQVEKIAQNYPEPADD